MPTITISIQPSPLVVFADITLIKVFRKANTTTPAESYLEEDFVEVPSLSISRTFTNPVITDTAGNVDYWYRAQTCDVNDRCAPMGWQLPGHGNSSFTILRSGYGHLSAFTPNALDAIFLYEEVHRATDYVVEHLLRPKFKLETLVTMYLDPLPMVRQITEIVAARSIIGQKRPSDEASLKFLDREFQRLAKEFAVKRSFETHEVEEVESDREYPADLQADWGR